MSPVKLGARVLLGLAVSGFSVFSFQNCAQSNYEFLSGPPSQVEALTTELATKAQGGDSSEGELLALAEARQKMLIEKLDKDPAEVLRLRLPEETRAEMPTAVRELVESEAEMEGELQVVIVHDSASKSHIEYSVKADRGDRRPLYLSRQPPRELLSGQRVRVKALALDKNLVLDPLSPEQLILAAESGPSYGSQPGHLGNTFGEQKSLVIRINFKDNNTRPLSKSAVASVMEEANTYYQEVSYGKAFLTSTVIGYFTIAASSATCDYQLFTEQAKAAALNAGYNVNNYDRILIAFPEVQQCGWGGVGTIGGAPSYAWFNGGFALSTVVHELGHNLGLFHAHSLNCGSTVLGENCSIDEYGSPVDTMGIARVGHFNAYHKERLGWLGSSLLKVESSGNYSIAPYEFTSTQPLALKVFKNMNPATGEKTWYYVEYRQPQGQDSSLRLVYGSNLTTGVVVHKGDELNGYNNFILDMTPQTSGAVVDAALVPGQQYDDATAGVSFRTVSASTAGASVEIQVAPPVCARSAPTLSLAAIGFSLLDFGSEVLHKVEVTNKNSFGCPDEVVNLNLTLPSGFTGQFNQSSVTLASGQSRVLSLVIQTPASGIAANYFPIIDAVAGDLSSSLTLTLGMTAWTGLPPVGRDDVVTTAPNQPITMTRTFLVANDTEPDGNTIQIDNRIGVASNGTITFNAPGSIVSDITYTPNPGFTGVDRFKYMVRDGPGYDVVEVVINVGDTSPTPVGDVTAPTVKITSPADGTRIRVRSTLKIEATASDDVLVNRVEFYVNGVRVCSDTSATYSCSYRMPDGAGVTYQIEARAIDSSNNSASDIISVLSTPR